MYRTIFTIFECSFTPYVANHILYRRIILFIAHSMMKHLTAIYKLTFPSEFKRVSSKPACSSGSSFSLGELTSFAQTTGRFTSGGKTTKFTMFLGSITHPVNLGIAGDCFVVGINHDYLEIFVGRILANPVRVQYSKSFKTTTNTFLSNRLQVPFWLLLINSTRSFGFTIRTSFCDWAFTSSTSHGNTINYKSLFILVSKTSSS